MLPQERWYNSKPDLSNIRVLGLEFYTLLPKPLRDDILVNVGLLVYFVGHSDANNERMLLQTINRKGERKSRYRLP